VKRLLCVAVGAALVLSLAIVGSGGATRHSTFIAALVSDVGKFNDKSFNQDQLAGLNRAHSVLNVSTLPLQSNSSSDYLPNMETAVRRHANIVMAAGFLLASTVAQVAAQNPNTDFTITDDSVHGSDFAKAKEIKNIEGLTYASNEAGCLVGYLAAEMVKMQGGKQVIGAVGGLNIPPVNNYIVGYKHCAQMYNPSIKVLTGYSNSFTDQSACQTVTQNQLGQGSQVEFQVAGGCGLATLNAAAAAGKWGIGVDVDQYALAKNVLTSAIKRVDVGIFDAIKQAEAGKFKGGSDLVFNLNNGGVGVGKISPKVPAKFIVAMNALRAKIMTGKVTIPSAS
jgi:basic membrane protein A and related proteins